MVRVAHGYSVEWIIRCNVRTRPAVGMVMKLIVVFPKTPVAIAGRRE
jgi:hypothetical protein